MLSKRLISLTLSLFIILGTAFAVFNRQEILDWWALRNYQPPAEIAKLSSDSGMSQNGQKYFYISQPELNNKQDFTVNCPFGEKTIVLGCYDGINIYILDIDDPKLEGVEAVTAAHEMLHAAYQRLSESEKTKINELLNDEFKTVSNQRILDLVAEYDTNDQALINNELHSILPTELEQLSPELETYYKQYFADRQKVVAAAKKYESVFVAIEDQRNVLVGQLDALKSQIDSLEARLENLRTQVDAGRTKLDNLESSNQIEQYNQYVPEFNSLVSEYNGIIPQIKSAVDAHNQIVNQINDLSVQQNELVNTINSNYQEL